MNGRSDLLALRTHLPAVAPWRLRVATWVESPRVQTFIVGPILPDSRAEVLLTRLETDLAELKKKLRKSGA